MELHHPKKALLATLVSILVTVCTWLFIHLSLPGAASAQYFNSLSPVIYLPITINQYPPLLNYQVDPGVPIVDVREIQVGIGFAQSNLGNTFGADIPDELQRTINVKIVATGQGNQEAGGGGACCTALDESGARPFFDVLHPNWIIVPPYPYNLTTHHQVTAAHEYIHAWQWSLGCLTIHEQPLGGWLNEGIAHYVGHDPFIRNGTMEKNDVRVFQFYSALDTGEADVPLSSLESPQGLWPGHIGYLAVEKLVSESPLGLLSLRSICEAVDGGTTVETAFENAFGITKEEFYQEFQEFIDSLKNTPCESKVPALMGPMDGSTLDTLAPLFQWQSEINPNTSAYFVETATDSNFTENFNRLGGGTRATEIRNPYNLIPATTYYWRVRSECGQDSVVYSEVWSFTTGSDGTFPSTPILIAPGNESTVSSIDVLMQWSPVPGAFDYAVNWRPAGVPEETYYIVANEAEIILSDLSTNTTFEWWVAARNDYGYGVDSQIWQFTTP